MAIDNCKKSHCSYNTRNERDNNDQLQYREGVSEWADHELRSGCTFYEALLDQGVRKDDLGEFHR